MYGLSLSAFKISRICRKKNILSSSKNIPRFFENDQEVHFGKHPAFYGKQLASVASEDIEPLTLSLSILRRWTDGSSAVQDGITLLHYTPLTDSIDLPTPCFI